jgi:hypothetical protein
MLNEYAILDYFYKPNQLYHPLNNYLSIHKKAFNFILDNIMQFYIITRVVQTIVFLVSDFITFKAINLPEINRKINGI